MALTTGDNPSQTPKTEPKPSPSASSPSATKAVKADAEFAAEAAKNTRDDALAAAKARHEAAVDLADRDLKEETERVEAEFAAHEDAEKRAKSGDLGPAGESSDPSVQAALAERETARLNRDAAAESVADRRLALLGVK